MLLSQALALVNHQTERHPEKQATRQQTREKAGKKATVLTRDNDHDTSACESEYHPRTTRPESSGPSQAAGGNGQSNRQQREQSLTPAEFLWKNARHGEATFSTASVTNQTGSHQTVPHEPPAGSFLHPSLRLSPKVWLKTVANAKPATCQNQTLVKRKPIPKASSPLKDSPSATRAMPQACQ